MIPLVRSVATRNRMTHIIWLIQGGWIERRGATANYRNLRSMKRWKLLVLFVNPIWYVILHMRWISFSHLQIEGVAYRWMRIGEGKLCRRHYNNKFRITLSSFRQIILFRARRWFRLLCLVIVVVIRELIIMIYPWNDGGGSGREGNFPYYRFKYRIRGTFSTYHLK